MCIKGKMRRVVRSLYVNNRSCIYLKGKSSEFFPVNQGVDWCVTLLSTYAFVWIHINGLLCEIRNALS